MGSEKRSVQKTIRFSPELYQRINDLPDRYGEDFASKVKTILRIGLERLEWERGVIRDAEKGGTEPPSAGTN